MCSTLKNMQLELNQIQRRIQFLKKQNQLLLNKKDKVKSSKTSKIICDVEPTRLNPYVSRDEEAVTNRYYRKSIELLKDQLNKKKAKEKLSVKKLIKRKCKNSQVSQNSYRIKGNVIGNSKETSLTKNDYDIVTILDKDNAEACDLYEKIIENPEDIDYSTDVEYLETVIPKNCIKNDSLNPKRKINLLLSKNEALKDITNSVERIATHKKSTESEKKLFCENSKSNNILQHDILDESINKQIVIDKVRTNNSREVEDHDIIFLQNVNKGSNIHDKDDKPTFFNLKLDKISKGTAKREVSSVDPHLKFDINLTKPLLGIKPSDVQICETYNISTNSLSSDIKFLKEDCLEFSAPELDFTEEPVDFPIPDLHKNETKYFSFEQKKVLEARGVKIKTGRWSKQEEALLCRNMKNFTAQFKIPVSVLLGIIRRTSSGKKLKINRKFWKKKHFLVRLGKDLNDRSLCSIYQKSRVLLMP